MYDEELDEELDLIDRKQRLIKLPDDLSAKETEALGKIITEAGSLGMSYKHCKRSPFDSYVTLVFQSED